MRVSRTLRHKQIKKNKRRLIVGISSVISIATVGVAHLPTPTYGLLSSLPVSEQSFQALPIFPVTITEMTLDAKAASERAELAWNVVDEIIKNGIDLSELFYEDGSVTSDVYGSPSVTSDVYGSFSNFNPLNFFIENAEYSVGADGYSDPTDSDFYYYYEDSAPSVMDDVYGIPLNFYGNDFFVDDDLYPNDIEGLTLLIELRTEQLNTIEQFYAEALSSKGEILKILTIFEGYKNDYPEVLRLQILLNSAIETIKIGMYIELAEEAVTKIEEQIDLLKVEIEELEDRLLGLIELEATAVFSSSGAGGTTGDGDENDKEESDEEDSEDKGQEDSDEGRENDHTDEDANIDDKQAIEEEVTDDEPSEKGEEETEQPKDEFGDSSEEIGQPEEKNGSEEELEQPTNHENGYLGENHANEPKQPETQEQSSESIPVESTSDPVASIRNIKFTYGTHYKS